MPSTPSSASAPDDPGPRPPSRAAIAALVIVSIAIPVAVLALILAHNGNGGSSASVQTPTTDVSPTDASKAKVGTPAPNFTLKSTTGATVRLSDLRGHPVVIAFFASWCNPCQEELPVLQDFAREDREQLRVIGVSFQDLPSDTAAFIRRLHVTFPALVDAPSAPTGQRYGVRGIPQTIFVDASGVVRGRVYGQTSKHALQPAIDDLLAGRNIRPI